MIQGRTGTLLLDDDEYGLQTNVTVLMLLFKPFRTLKDGKVVVFDDSFEHEVWQNGTSFSMVLIADIWHPQLTAHQKATLSPI